MNHHPPIEQQSCDNCRYQRHRRGEDLCCIKPPQLGASGLMPICPISRWCGEWAER